MIKFVSFSFLLIVSWTASADERPRFARADTDGGYVHWIELYDEKSNRIEAGNPNAQPYSPRKTCGRCHDFDQIAHGWHFDAVEQIESERGRVGQPWIWNDPRTGTYLPLSYRDWPGTYNPDEIGISRWSMTKQFGGFLPGGGPGTKEALLKKVGQEIGTAAGELAPKAIDRSAITGELPIDCMLCHRSGGSYSAEVWTKQIELENFAFAPTVAAGLATIEGSLSRVRESIEIASPESIPSLTYDVHQFRPDGKVFFNIARMPENRSCLHCHTNLPSGDLATQRWSHDMDVHLRAGMNCVDCHRHGLDHEIVRGYPEPNHPNRDLISTLSCQGCHLGEAFPKLASASDARTATEIQKGGRMGAPKPMHAGLPPLHFDKLTCTACHSGPSIAATPARQLTSQAHALGIHARRTGSELPAIFAPVMLPELWNQAPVKSTRPVESPYAPHRVMWPSFWGLMMKDKITPMDPEKVFLQTRKALKVKKDLGEEIGEVKPSAADRKKILGDVRGLTKPEEWTSDEQQKLAEWMEAQGKIQMDTRISDALEAIAQANPSEGIEVYVTGGKVFRRGEKEKLEVIGEEDIGSAALPTAWPIGHNVRPARFSLGATGCLECHQAGSPFFESKIVANGLLLGQAKASFTVHELQNADMVRLQSWNRVFWGRALFKYFAFVCLGLTAFVTLSCLGWTISSRLAGKGNPHDI